MNKSSVLILSVGLALIVATGAFAKSGLARHDPVFPMHAADSLHSAKKTPHRAERRLNPAHQHRR
jgi:hypothetical protein